MPQPSPCLTGILLLLAGLGGCSTPSPQQTRIAELPGDFAQLPASEQSSIRKGAIAAGYTLQMVYMALGRPDAIEALANGRQVQWTYRNFYPSAAVNNTPLYRVPKIDPLQRNLQQWNNAGRPSRDNVMTGNMEYRKPPETPDPGNGGPDVPGVTLAVMFLDGKVLQYAYDGKDLWN